ncbi:hypothetical protein [Burkholderia cepacia]|uniref:hypothetical protein n=1 Tax=Burkholderia cepacia TaxID=292 RepID=UPI001E3D06C0|nr:hypothetical protein [Burkholderia cepacia]
MTRFDDARLEFIYARGYESFNSGDLDSATYDFGFLILHRPLDFRFHFAFACALKLHGEFRYAINFFCFAVAMKSDDPFCSFHIAECLLALNEVESARDALDAVISLCHGQTNEGWRYDQLRHKAESMIIKLSR